MKMKESAFRIVLLEQRLSNASLVAMDHGNAPRIELDEFLEMARAAYRNTFSDYSQLDRAFSDAQRDE